MRDLVCGKFNFKVCSTLYFEQVAKYHEMTNSENYEFQTYENLHGN